MTNQTTILKIKKAELKQIADLLGLDTPGFDKFELQTEITEFTLKGWAKADIKAYAKELKLEDVKNAGDFAYELATEKNAVLVPTQMDAPQAAPAPEAAPAKTDEELVEEMTKDNTGRNLAIGAGIAAGAAILAPLGLIALGMAAQPKAKKLGRHQGGNWCGHA